MGRLVAPPRKSTQQELSLNSAPLSDAPPAIGKDKHLIFELRMNDCPFDAMLSGIQMMGRQITADSSS